MPPSTQRPKLAGRASKRLLGAFQVAAARLRFLVVFAVVFAVIGGWETIRTYWAKLTTSPTSESATSSDTEFFCPMDPGVLSDWPSKCPVCNMSLVRHHRGESVPMPDGVMARMQLTPYRLALGGIKTETVKYAPLARELELPGIVRELISTQATVEADVFARELAWIEPGRPVEIVSTAEIGHPIMSGTIRDLPRSVEAGSMGKLIVGIEGTNASLQVGERVRVLVRCPVDRLEPFRGQPTNPPPIAPGELRRLYLCMDHPTVIRESPGSCSRDGAELMPRPLLGDQRVGWWCPMHPDRTADRPGAKCDACGGMALAPRVVSYRPEGSVLAIPCSAAIDDRSRAIVYVDRGAGMFDAKIVTLGPRCGTMFPVASGLEPGDRVVAQGGFLIDAETRLDPSLASGYFGAGEGASTGKPTAPAPATRPDEAWLSRLDEADRPQAARQKLCPVTGKLLGSMGVPLKVALRGRTVFLCCAGCSGAIEADPEKFLAKLADRDKGHHP